MKRFASITATVCLGFLMGVLPAAGESPLELLSGMEDGLVRLSFETRPGVYGRGESISVNEDSPPPGSGWEQGPLHLLLDFRKGKLRDVELRVGSTAPRARGEVRDLGGIPSGEAAEALLALAARGSGPALDELLFPAVVARDAVVWPELLSLARDESRSSDLRGSAIFWLGQAAGRAATEGLTRILDDEDAELEIREQAIFSLSQRSSSECIPILSRVATANPHPQLREQALFWLAQHDDPRVLQLFEEILLGN